MVPIIAYLVYGSQADRQTGKLKSKGFLFIFYSYILNAFYLFSCVFSHVSVYFIIFCSVSFTTKQHKITQVALGNPNHTFIYKNWPNANNGQDISLNEEIHLLNQVENLLFYSFP